MSNWNPTTLGNHIETQKGFAFKSLWFTDTGRRVVKVSNFSEDSIDDSGLISIPESIAVDYSKYELFPGDVILQTVGSWPSNPASVVGKCVRCPKHLHRVLLNQNAVRLSPDENLDKGFLYYLLRDERFKSFIVGTAQGAASQAAITLDSIRAFQFSIPQLETQRRIASILSAYDDLIENNTRRIAILEEMARRIYGEWFVRFRFPGHEQVKMVESELGMIPEGWQATHLKALCKVVEDGDWIETKDQGGNDYRLLQISNLGLNSFVETGNFRFISEATFRRLRCREVLPGHILVARMPKPIGRAWLVTSQNWRMVTAVDVAILEADSTKTSPEFLLHFLNSEQTLASFAGQTTGTTRPRITRKQIEAMPILAPTEEVSLKFRDIVKPMNDLRDLLAKKNTNLRTTRDLLLPKLISGELDVSHSLEPEEVAA
jgi:type I restriction enzyme S subunit